MSHVYIGNLTPDCRDSDVERLFLGYGRMTHIELKGVYGFLKPDYSFLKNEDATVMVWRVVDEKLEREDNTSHGTFFLGDSYVIYNKKKNFVYYWFGDESSKEEREKAEHVATQLCHHVGKSIFLYVFSSLLYKNSF